MNLLVISHTPHYRQGAQIVGWGPTIREIDQLAARFHHVYHLAVLYEEPAPQSSLPYTADNISVIPIRPAGGETLVAKLDVLWAYLGYWKTIRQVVNTLNSEDIIHIRCPANISLLAVIYLIFTKKIRYRWIKYAGNWQPEERTPWTYTLQRWLLKKNLARSLVTVNGRWQRQPKHILSFYNPSLSKKNLQKSTNDGIKKISPPFQLLCVGNINEMKGTSRAVQAVLNLIASGLDVELDIIGDGELRSTLEFKTSQQKQIRFHGALPHESIMPFYARAHFILLPSRTEGWPKVLSEAMAYGVVPLAGAVSSIPQILQECKTGMALDPLDTQAFANAICDYVHDPQRWSAESQAAQKAADWFTYEAYLEHLNSVFSEKWQKNLK